MENKKRLNKVIVGIMLCILAAAVLIFFPLFLTEQLDNVTDSTLAETSKKNANLISYQLTHQCSMIQAVAEQLETSISSTDIKDTDIKSAVDSLRGIDATGALMRYGFALPDRQCYYIDENGVGQYSFIPQSNHLADAIHSKNVTIYKLNSDQSIDGNKSFVIQVPIFNGNKAAGVFYFTYNMEKIRQLLGSNAYNGAEHFAIIDKTGSLMLSSDFDVYDNKTAFDLLNYLYNDSDEASVNYKKMMVDMSESRSGFFCSESLFKNSYHISYESLDFNGWYIISYVPQNVVNSSRNTVITYIFLMCFFLIILFSLFGIYIMTEERAKKKEIDQMLYTDSLTGGSSYAKFCLDAKKQLLKSKDKLAYIVMDIDFFKLVNDYYGYEQGNKTLRFIYTLWEEILKENEFVCRLAADRFAVLIHYDTTDEIEKRISEFNNRCHKFYDGTSTDYILTPSIGVYMIERGETNLQRLQTKAVMAKSTVKGNREKVFAFYDDSLKQTLSERKALEDELDLAIENKTLNVIFQPQLDAVTKKVCGAEALVRWRKGNGEFVPPDEFVTLAEERGLIIPLDRFIFDEVCQYQAKWQEMGLPPIDFSINLSQKSLHANNIVERCKRHATDSGADINHIHLEITETTIFKNTKLFIKIIRQFRKAGFKILLDDFGTGYSSIMLLKSMPIDFLKLDKSFIDNHGDKRGETIIECVIELAKRLNFDVIAEGVETEEQYLYLRDLKCDIIQGYLFGKPMSFEDLQTLVKNQETQKDAYLE